MIFKSKVKNFKSEMSSQVFWDFFSDFILGIVRGASIR